MVEHATIGPLQALGVPVKLSDTPGGIDTPPPRLGQHTDAVLRQDLGLDADAIAAFARKVSSNGMSLRSPTAERNDRAREKAGRRAPRALR